MDNQIVTYKKNEFLLKDTSEFVSYEVLMGWLKDYVTDTIGEYFSNNDYNNIVNIIGDMKIGYDLQISSIQNGIISQTTKLETLNSIVDGNQSYIRNLLETYATKDYTYALARSTLVSSLNNGEIRASLDSINLTLATQTNALSQRSDVLESVINEVGSKASANATALEGMQTSVSNLNGIVVSQATKLTELNSSLTDTDGNLLAGSGTTVGQVVNTTIDKATNEIATYAAYSNVHKIVYNGVTYYDGFGQYSGYGPDRGYDSSFWVAANNFKIYDPSSLNESNVSYETINVLNPTTKQYEQKRIVTNIANAKSIFEVNAQTKEVEINGNLIVNGTVQAKEIAANSLTEFLYNSGDSYYTAVTIPPIQQYTLGESYVGNIAVIGTFTQGTGKNGHAWDLKIDGILRRTEGPREGTLGVITFSVPIDLTQYHVVELTCQTLSGDGGCELTILKRTR